MLSSGMSDTTAIRSWRDELVIITLNRRHADDIDDALSTAGYNFKTALLKELEKKTPSCWSRLPSKNTDRQALVTNLYFSIQSKRDRFVIQGVLYCTVHCICTSVYTHVLL